MNAGTVWPPAHRRAVALFYGLLCHSLFLAAIVSAMVAMYHGMSLGLGPRTRPWSFGWDLLLLLQFPLLHSFLLSKRGHRWLVRLAPEWAASTLTTTLFTIVASLQMLALYLLWAPIGPVWWEAQGLTKVIWTAVYAACWLILAKAMSDASLATQTGFLGWSALFRGQRPDYGKMPECGLFRHTRQPIYLGYVLIVWSVPTWTADQLILSLWLTAYCLLGPRLKEARYAQRYGQQFTDYCQRVRYFLPNRALGRTSASLLCGERLLRAVGKRIKGSEENAT